MIHFFVQYSFSCFIMKKISTSAKIFAKKTSRQTFSTVLIVMLLLGGVALTVSSFSGPPAGCTPASCPANPLKVVLTGTGQVRIGDTGQHKELCLNGKCISDWADLAPVLPACTKLSTGTLDHLPKMGGFSQNQCGGATPSTIIPQGAKYLTYTISCIAGSCGGPHIDTSKFSVVDKNGSVLWSTSNKDCGSGVVSIPSGATSLKAEGYGCNGSCADQFIVAASGTYEFWTTNPTQCH